MEMSDQERRINHLTQRCKKGHISHTTAPQAEGGDKKPNRVKFTSVTEQYGYLTWRLLNQKRRKIRKKPCPRQNRRPFIANNCSYVCTNQWHEKIVAKTFNPATSEGALIIPGRKRSTPICKLVYSRRNFRDEEPYVYLDGIHTNPRYQRKGAGTAMTQHFLEEVVQKDHPDIKRVTLWLSPGRGENDPAERLYQNFGFHFESDQEQHYMTLYMDRYRGYRHPSYDQFTAL
ncbi:acetyltransferase (GNAT) family domain-containing protein [Ditylenchus destructor]|uniref:Acetyltransferase (GNAT) family domain-containing protein n=1 Tax=Ditylenchus destructor TaxID=166010 RepID=A0AAD4NGB6_9BILA|nr:acetyltransferase (GNAT) family domain-containing protein [Ditylenchus destructor]